MSSILSVMCVLSVGAGERVDETPRAAGAVEALRSVGVFEAESLNPIDLAELPAKFWPTGVTFDPTDLSLTFATGATVAVGAQPATAENRKLASRKLYRSPGDLGD